MKKLMLSALVAGMFMIGSVYAQTTAPATGKPATSQSPASGTKSDKPVKTHKKGTKKATTGKPAAAPKTSTGAAGQK